MEYEVDISEFIMTRDRLIKRRDLESDPHVLQLIDRDLDYVMHEIAVMSAH